MITSRLTEYSMRVNERVTETFSTDIKYTIKKIQEDIDNKKRTTTTTPVNNI